MRIYIDLDSRRFFSTITRSLTRLEFKRRDNDAFEVQFLRAGIVQELPAGTVARVGLKATDDYAGEFLASDTLAKSGTGTDAVYAGEFNLNTTLLEGLFASEPDSVTAMLEVQWQSGAQVGSSLTLPVSIFNDVIRGDEGDPATLPIFYTSSTSDFLATQAEAEAGSDNTKWMSPLRVAQAIEELGVGGGVSSWNDLTDKPASFAPSTHTHALGDLTQSAATTGQVATWDGTAWVPEDPAVGVTSYNDLTDVPTEFQPSDHTHAASDITSGTLAIARIPTGTTSTTVALGNHTHTFGTTAGTFCQGNDSRLSDARTPTAHTHGNITNTGAIGTTSGVPIITGTSGVLQAGAFGTTAGTFCQGNDSRLLNISGGITAIAVVATMPATPTATTLYIVTG